jgi:uncharacterized damage-inducible protein DinB
MLTTYLDYARATVHAKCAGISAEHARLAPLATSPLMSVAGLVNHLCWVEYSWFAVDLLGEADDRPWAASDPDRELRVGATIPVADLLAKYGQVCQRNRELAATLDLDTRSVREVAGAAVTLRWILFHLIEETARHNGHLDILRELADGTTGR